MTNTRSPDAHKSVVLPFTLDPIRLHSKAANSFQRVLLEIHADSPNYSAALSHLANASNALGALALIDCAGQRAEASNDDVVANETITAETSLPKNSGNETDQNTQAATASLPTTGYRKAYCEKLCSTICRYLDAAETEELAVALTRFTDAMTQRSYKPGLSQAAYDLFARFALRSAK